MHKWFVYPEITEASQQAAEYLANIIQESIDKNNVCHIALPGGNTPALCFKYLAKKNLPWNKIHWYPGDERCYPVGHHDRNDVMLQNNLWAHISETNIHKIPAELGAETGAEEYRTLIDTINNFDIAFLGMGEDGHTASLFPGNEALQDIRSVVPVHLSPKPPSERISLSKNTLQKASYRIVLASGSEKSNVISRIKQGEMLPINQLGDIIWFVDEAVLSN